MPHAQACKQGVQGLQHRHHVLLFIERRQQHADQWISRALGRSGLQGEGGLAIGSLLRLIGG